MIPKACHQRVSGLVTKLGKKFFSKKTKKIHSIVAISRFKSAQTLVKQRIREIKKTLLKGLTKKK